MTDHERRLHGLLRFCESPHVADRAEAARDAAALRWALAGLDRLRSAKLSGTGDCPTHHRPYCRLPDVRASGCPECLAAEGDAEQARADRLAAALWSLLSLLPHGVGTDAWGHAVSLARKTLEADRD